MKLIVGLGNPGDRYSGTRHNIGRAVVERASEQAKEPFKKEKALKASLAQVEWADESVVLAYPDTYMNLSGQAVFMLVRHFEIKPEEDLLVLIDDVALPYERLRLRGKGSDGGHNGLKSVEQLLGTSHYARLRIGIAPQDPQKGIDLEEYVLEEFSQKEQKGLPALLERSYEACQLWATHSLEAAMNAVNPSES